MIHRADAHDAGACGATGKGPWSSFGAHQKGAIELMLARVGPPERGHRADAHDAGPFGGDRKVTLMMLTCLGRSGKGPSS